MSFASYKSPFDEAMSKPLISDDDTQGVTNCTNTLSSNSNSPVAMNSTNPFDDNVHNTASGTSSAAPTATSKTTFHSKKLRVEKSFTSNSVSSKPPAESFSKFHIESHTTSPPSSSEEYQPPSLMFDTEYEQQSTSLEAALLRERNEESRSILQKMNTINAISTELNSLVASQQENVDEMEENAYRIHDSAERGVSELEKANSMMQKNNGSGVEVFWKVFFGVIGVGGLIIAFVIFLHSM